MSQTTSAATANATGVSVLPVGISSGSPSKFSGASFAAGFIPGIFLGILATACLLLILFRKRRGSADSYMDEKQSPRDTLTDLATLSRRPTMHGRSISEPAMDPTAVHRTDFLRGTPPRSADPLAPMQANYTVEATGPVTPARTPKAVKALFSHSPFMNQTPSTPPSTQPPMPAHLKRGTLSFKISPVRALKKQKSMHSLRRQMTSVSRSSSRRTRPDVSRSGSTETIQVLMPSNEPYTPDQRLRASAEQAPSTSESFVNHQQQTSVSSPTSSDSSSASTARPFAPTAYASSTRFPVNTSTPARQPNRDMEATLGTPYTPSRYYGNGKGRATDVLLGNDGGLRVIREPEKRDTTFSGMMAKAGLRESDLTMGTAGR